MEVYFPEDIYKLVCGKTTVRAMVNAGTFPAPFYVNSGPVKPQGKRWTKEAVDRWMAERIKQAESDRAKAGLIGARLIRGRHQEAA